MNLTSRIDRTACSRGNSWDCSGKQLGELAFDFRRRWRSQALPLSSNACLASSDLYFLFTPLVLTSPSLSPMPKILVLLEIVCFLRGL
jgi:hypothetical protein